jgi:hypothetical protein
MKYSFQLSLHRRANVWIDEAPPAAFAASSCLNRTVMKPRSAIEAARTIAGVEVNFTHGPKSSYALLGAELIEAEADGFEICVLVNDGGVPFLGSLAGRRDEVRVGLPAEYATAVVSGAVRIAESIAAPPKRKLWFRWAAHGLINSSPSIFEQVSGIVLQLLIIPTVVDDAKIRTLLQCA